MSMKERIDAFRKGEANIEKAKEQPIDANGIILGKFLEGYIPVDEYGPGVVIMTTDDIISALDNMADIGQADVNLALATIGFKPGRNSSGSFGWMMKHIRL